MNDVTISIDLAYDTFAAAGAADALRNGADITHLAGLVAHRGVQPDRLVVVTAVGPGGGNPDCHATFADESRARMWFAWITEDASPAWFDENRI